VADYNMCESLYMYVLVPRSDRVGMTRRVKAKAKVKIKVDFEMRSLRVVQSIIMLFFANTMLMQ